MDTEPLKEASPPPFVAPPSAPSASQGSNSRPRRAARNQSRLKEVIEFDSPEAGKREEEGQGDSNEPTYCICSQVSFGEMIGTVSCFFNHFL